MKLTNVMKGLTGLAAGAFLGGAAGVGVAAALMYWEKWRHPEDPSATSAGIIVVLTFPLGLFLGLFAGGRFADRWIKRGKEKAAGFDVVMKRGEGTPR